jgi:hypothetical protein
MAAQAIRPTPPSPVTPQPPNYGNTPLSVGGKVLFDTFLGGVTTAGSRLASERLIAPLLGQTAANIGASVFTNPSVDVGAAAFVISTSENVLPRVGDYLVGVGQSLLNDFLTPQNPNAPSNAPQR